VKRRVAVVEDNFENRLLARIILSPHYEVTEYGDGSEALSAFAREVPDLVLLDISLPGLDGTEVLARIRAHPDWRSIPVVAFTAFASTREREGYLAAGFNDHISKPITDKQAMLRLLGRLIDPAA
jgi:CheY-like chemotaxis protein